MMPTTSLPCYKSDYPVHVLLAADVPATKNIIFLTRISVDKKIKFIAKPNVLFYYEDNDHLKAPG